MNSYEAKQEARRERLERASAKAAGEASALSSRASRMADRIPFGQPILVGHHSEGRDRGYRARISRTFDRAHEAHARSLDLASRAESIGTGGISSDDPEAVTKLRAGLAELQADLVRMRAINKAYVAFVKSPGSPWTAGLSYDDQATVRRFVPQWSKDKPFTFQLTNGASNARRIQKRIDDLLAASAQPAREPVIGDGWMVAEDRDENRVAITFDGIPSEQVRAGLKGRGFKWSPTRKAWARMLNNAAWSAALDVTREARPGQPSGNPGEFNSDRRED